MKFKDIVPYTKDGSYRVHHSLRHFKSAIERYIEEGLQLNPDFQRGYVWTEEQQIKFVEHLLKGGKTNPIFLNQKGWMRDFQGDFVCVDGLQRITACLRFLNNEIKAFDHFYNQFEDTLSNLISLEFVINDLPTKADVLQWYIELNTGGTVHSIEEIKRVQTLLEKEITNGTK
ncbi:DUF262 domain-containing protein [Bacillus velezensis]|uniref:DUF262 domain-containing protein n=1 Tax=Bacillus velezensis TaxID=492670 RepID=UPI001C02AB09|nr:DUF262 domain-containing protein [Bacillus velezensis]QWK23496.1 DUF262 domain-containing protein [Bacillus velezensis]